ncbi:MAG: phosphoribosylaminoimidazolesuccinocarboxamide synthase [Mariprofundaceae bacterium]|nr:phosphoribosylaminoimidazolesuccinocarboxamide synthase [Mariprofundaceae bacterium]
MKALYEGKCKELFSTEINGELIQLFKDDTTAFDGKKHEVLANKGVLNCAISSFIFEKLHQSDIATHYIRREKNAEMRVHHLNMMPVEIVVRNVAAGSICRRLGLKEGSVLPRPLTELFYKSDELGDPLINEEHADMFGWANKEDVATMFKIALNVNQALCKLFNNVGIQLIDYKLEFGKTKDGSIVLGDEITPDACRLWDQITGKKLDKDVFRQDLGGLTEVYHEVASRLGVTVEMSS